MLTPVYTMFAATASATIGSSARHPVSATKPTPAMTPADVQTSVKRCFALASRDTDWWRRPARKMMSAAARLMTDAAIETAMPTPICSSARGWKSRSTAAIPMPTAAAKISEPSKKLEKYSALP